MRTKQIVIDAMKRLLEKHTFESIRIQDIVEEAGIAKTTFYRHFQSKYELATAIFSENITKNTFLEYNGENFYEMNEKNFIFIRENKDYFSKLFKMTGPESFYSFLVGYNSEFCIQQAKYRFGIEELSRKQLFKIDTVANAWAHSMKTWVEDDCRIPCREWLSWMKEMNLTIEDIFP